MTSPVMDENILQFLTKEPPSIDNIDRLQTASLMAIVDAFDRKVTRDNFVMIAATAMTLGQVMARLGILKSTEGFFNGGDLNTAMFDQATKGLMAMAATQHAVLERQVSVLVQCPNDKDPVH